MDAATIGFGRSGRPRDEFNAGCVNLLEAGAGVVPEGDGGVGGEGEALVVAEEEPAAEVAGGGEGGVEALG